MYTQKVEKVDCSMSQDTKAVAYTPAEVSADTKGYNFGPVSIEGVYPRRNRQEGVRSPLSGHKGLD